MAMTIWKYPLGAAKAVFPFFYSFEMPHGAMILSLQVQNGMPTLWALLDPAQPPETRRFQRTGTGWEMKDIPRRYVGTYQEGMFVWHLFELMGEVKWENQ